MDACLFRFCQISFDPKDEKFDPNVHEDIFTILESEQDHNAGGVVMQSGWKIGEHVLKATKVEIIKKSNN